MTYPNGKSLRSTWINDKVNCKDAYQNAQNVKPLASIKYSQKSTPFTLPAKASDFFVSKDEDNCPLVKCEIKPAGCKGAYKGNLAVSKGFAITAKADDQKGWDETVCVVCTGETKV